MVHELLDDVISLLGRELPKEDSRIRYFTPVTIPVSGGLQKIHGSGHGFIMVTGSSTRFRIDDPYGGGTATNPRTFFGVPGTVFPLPFKELFAVPNGIEEGTLLVSTSPFSFLRLSDISDRIERQLGNIRLRDGNGVELADVEVDAATFAANIGLVTQAKNYGFDGATWARLRAVADAVTIAAGLNGLYNLSSIYGFDGTTPRRALITTTGLFRSDGQNIRNNVDSLVEVSALVTNPASGTIITDTGALATAGLYEFEIQILSSVAAVHDVIHRNAANNANINFLRFGAAANASFTAKRFFNVAANERVRIESPSAVTGDLQASISGFRWRDT